MWVGIIRCVICGYWVSKFHNNNLWGSTFQQLYQNEIEMEQQSKVKQKQNTIVDTSFCHLHFNYNVHGALWTKNPKNEP